MDVPLELWQLIFDHIDFLSKIRLRQVNSLFLYLPIVDLHHIEYRYLGLLNDNILRQHPFTKKLFAFDNPNITSVNHLVYLEELDASWECGINDDGLQITSLKKLDVNGNERVKNIQHMAGLKTLFAIGKCGLSNEGLLGLKLEMLDSHGNTKIDPTLF
jgi:hypothetical protein